MTQIVTEIEGIIQRESNSKNDETISMYEDAITELQELIKSGMSKKRGNQLISIEDKFNFNLHHLNNLLII